MRSPFLPLLLLISACGGDSGMTVSDDAEAALIEHLKILDELQSSATIWTDWGEKHYELEKPFLTSRLRQEKKKELTKGMEAWGPYDIEAKYQVTHREKEGETVRIHLIEEFNEKTFTGKGSKIDRKTKQLRFMLTLENDHWVILKKWDECFYCKGTAKCSTCKGTGARAGKDKCHQCDGRKTCSKCPDGFKSTEELKISNTMVLMDGHAWKEDRSTPEETAVSWADLQVRQEYEMSKITKRFGEMIFEKLQGVYHSSILDMAKAKLKRVAAEAKKGKKPPVVVSVDKTSADGAYAVIEEKITWYSLDGKMTKIRESTQRKRLVLQKVGDEWLIDKVQDRCRQCEESDKKDCQECKGEKFVDPPEIETGDRG